MSSYSVHVPETGEEFQCYHFKPTSTKISSQKIFFAHANGVSAQTYRTLFEKMSERFGVEIVTYDMRGIGKTKAPFQINKKKWGWFELIEDHIRLFHLTQKLFPPSTKWILSGHSLGAWLALLSAHRLQQTQLLLFDPPILKPKIVLQWNFARLIGRKDLSPTSKKARKRRTVFDSGEVLFSQLKQRPFTRNWSDAVIADYIEGNYRLQEEGMTLRHDPLWEAHLFEEYLPSATAGFLKMPRSIRQSIHPLFVVGEDSDTCNPRAKKWVQFFLPQARWHVIERGSHMFPLEEQEQTLNAIAELFPTTS